MNRYRSWLLIGLALLLGPLSLTGCASRSWVKNETIQELRVQNERRARRIARLEDQVRTLQSRLERKNQQISSLERNLQRKDNTRRSLREELRGVRRDRDRIQQRLNTLKPRLNAALKALSQTTDVVASSNTTMSQLNDRLTRFVSDKRQRIDQLQRQNQQLQRQLSRVQDASAHQDGNNVVIRIDSRILFQLGEYSLREGARRTLNQVADIIGQHPDRPVAVKGHTDTVPVRPGAPFPTNWHLSAFRAVSVVQYLTDQRALSPDRFMAAGYGEHQPLVPNTSPENRKQNRRVELVLYPPNFETRSIDADLRARR